MSSNEPEVIATFKADDGCTVTITDLGRQEPSGRIKYLFTTDAGHLGEIWGDGPLPTSSLIDSAFEFLDGWEDEDGPFIEALPAATP